MPLFEYDHVQHKDHLCSIVAEGVTVDVYKELVKNAKFLCKQCGRVATRTENLCEPIPLE